MAEVILTITNPVTSASELLDLSENENISLTFKFTDISELDVRGSFTRQFRVPATDRNVELFGPLFDVNYSGDFSFHKKAKATLTVDTLPINGGHIQMRRVYLQKGQYADFEVCFFAETPDLARTLGTSKISDLDFSSLQHDISFADVRDGGTDWKYALTDRGQRWTEAEGNGQRPVLSTAVPVYPNEATLIIKWLWLFEKILANAGFTYTGSTLATSLAGIWMPFVKTKVNQTGIPEQNYFFQVGIAADQPGFEAGGSPGGGGGALIPSMVEVYDNNNDFASNVWTAPYTGYFTFKAWATIDPFSFPDSELAHLTIRRISPVTGVIKTVTKVVTSGAQFGMQLVTEPTFCVQGQTFGLYCGLSNHLADLSVTLKSAEGAGTGWAMIAADSPIAGQPILIPANCPEYLQIDFIKDVAKMHNLAIIPDRNVPNKLSMVPLPEYLAAGAVKDWTGKLTIDKDKDIIIDPTTAIQKKKLTFSYKLGSEAASKLYEKNGRIYGNFVADGYSAGQPNEFADGELKIELSIGSTPCSYIDNTGIIIPKFVNESGEFQDPGPRALFITGQTSIALYNETTGLAEFIDINLVGHYSEVDPDITDIDLNWAPEAPLHAITGNPFNNLFNRFYRAYINEIYSDQARIMEAWFALTVTDILTFKFNDKIWIKDAYWRILEINDYGVGLKELTKVKLIKILGAIRDCSVTPVAVGRNGIISWENNEGDPADATEQCCLRYGYQWNPEDETCRSISGAGGPVPGSGGIGTGRLPSGASAENLLRSLVEPGSEQGSVLSGMDITLRSGNPGSLIVGDTIDVAADLGGVTVTGRNAVVGFPGEHRAAGFQEGGERLATGSAQAGHVILFGNGNWMTDGSEIAIDSEGRHINIPDNSTLSLEVRLVAHRYSSTSGRIIQNHYATFVALINKTGGVAYVKKQDTIFQDGNFGTLDLVIDTTTDPTQHRMSIQSSSAAEYPIDTVRITADVSYTQVVTLGIAEFLTFKSLIKETEIMDIFIPSSPAWEQLSDVTSSHAPNKVSFKANVSNPYAAAVVEAQTAIGTANALGSPTNWGYVMVTAFFDHQNGCWTFIMENQA